MCTPGRGWRLGFSLGLEIAASRGVGMEAGGFPPVLCLLGALALRAGGLGARALSVQVDFFPLSPSPPICCGGRACVSACVRACLSLGFLLFVILGRGWLGGVQLLQVSNRACFRLGTAAVGLPHSLLKCSRKNLGGADRISLIPSLPLPQAPEQPAPRLPCTRRAPQGPAAQRGLPQQRAAPGSCLHRNSARI